MLMGLINMMKLSYYASHETRNLEESWQKWSSSLQINYGGIILYDDLG